MQPEIVIVVAACLCCLGVLSAEPMFPISNRPEIFRGSGQILFAAVNFAITVSSLSLLIWSFTKITWYVNIGLIVGALFGAAIVFQFLPAILRESAIGPFVSAIGLIVLHNWAWFVA